MRVPGPVAEIAIAAETDFGPGLTQTLDDLLPVASDATEDFSVLLCGTAQLDFAVGILVLVAVLRTARLDVVRLVAGD